MRNLNEYINEYMMQASKFHSYVNEYLSTKPTNKEMLEYNELNFPTDISKESVVEFLKSFGFKEKHIEDQTFMYLTDELENSEKPTFIIGPYNNSNIYSHWICFSKGGKTTKDNPCLFIRTADGLEPNERFKVWYKSLRFGKFEEDQEVVMSLKEFISIVNKSLQNM